MKPELPDLTELDFDERSHIYRLNGEIIPSVSAVMSPLSQFKYAGVQWGTLNMAASKGTEVHNAIEVYLNYGIEDISDANRGYFEAFLKWKNIYTPEISATEYKVYHKLMRYAGTCDLICSIGGVPSLVDYKTTATVSDMTCSIQLEAYLQALKSQGIEISRKIILHLKNNGEYDVREYPAKDIESLQVFGALYTLYNYMKKYSKA